MGPEKFSGPPRIEIACLDLNVCFENIKRIASSKWGHLTHRRDRNQQAEKVPGTETPDPTEPVFFHAGAISLEIDSDRLPSGLRPGLFE